MLFRTILRNSCVLDYIDKFGFYKGYLIFNGDLLKIRDLIFETDDLSEESLTKAILAKNAIRTKPVEGVIVEFEQYDKLTTKEPCTSLVFYNLQNGKQIFSATLKGHQIPSEDTISDYICKAEICINENKYII